MMAVRMVTRCRQHGGLHPAPGTPDGTPDGYRHPGKAIQLLLHPPEFTLAPFLLPYSPLQLEQWVDGMKLFSLSRNGCKMIWKSYKREGTTHIRNGRLE